MEKQHLYLLFLMLAWLSGSADCALAFKIVEKDADGTHIRAPFVHVDVPGANGEGSNVRVRAPFVKVDNPPGDGNVKVKAPFTKVGTDASTGDVKVNAPFTKVDNPPGKGNVNVKAPFTKIQKSTDSSAQPLNSKAPSTY
jgi:hypothetical protein